MATLRKLLILLLLLLTSTALAVQVKPPRGVLTVDKFDPINRGLVGCWLMNEGGGNRVNDLSGNGKTVSLTNAYFAAGPSGPAVVFDGTGDYGVVGSYIPAIAAASDYTIHMRVLVAARNSIQFIMSQVRSTSDRFGIYVADSAACTISISHYDGAAYNRYNTSTLSYGVWYYVTCVNYADKTKAIYINGILASSTGTSGVSPGATGTNEFVVAGNSAHASTLNGTISHLSVYNRALSPSEIARLYRDPWAGIQQDPLIMYATAGGEPPATSPVPVFQRHYEQMRAGVPVALPILTILSMAFLMRRSKTCDE